MRFGVLRPEISPKEFASIEKRHETKWWNRIRMIVMSLEASVIDCKQSTEAKLSQTLKYRSAGW